MRMTALSAAMFLCMAIFLAHNHSAYAEPKQQQIKLEKVTAASDSGSSLKEELKVEEKKPEPKAKKPVEHVVAGGETLESIAKAHNTTWQRLFYKNVGIANQDTINVGEKIVIPEADEQLAERPIAAPAAPVSSTPKQQSSGVAPRGASGGNGYSYGYCTWYAKNRRPDLPNNLGNADTWVSRAAAQGIPTGSAPRVGAIGQQGMHVVYIESVNGDGTVTISEMNYNGWNVTSSRTA